MPPCASVLASLSPASSAPAPPPRLPASSAQSASRLAPPLALAFAEEAHASSAKAIAHYLDIVDAAAASSPDGWQVAVTAAALDSLVSRSIGALGSITADAGLVYRTEDPSLVRSDSFAAEERAQGSIAARLARAFDHAEGPFVRSLIALAMTEIAEHRGDIEASSRWREASGCAHEATIVGPLDWAPLGGVQGPDPLSTFDAKLAESYAAPGGFAPQLAPVIERGRGCSLDLSAASSNPGVRDVVVDVEVKREGRIGVSLRSGATATLRAGGKVVIERPYELGGGNVTRFAQVLVKPGVLRLVARVGMDQEGESVRIAAWDAQGKPLPMRAPRPGEAATVVVTSGEPLAYPSAHTPTEELTVALAALAMDDPRSAEYVLENDAGRAGAPPDLALVYGRALESANDLTTVHRSERARTAYERTLAAWPDAWEAILAHAWLAGQKRGSSDAHFAEIDDLAALRSHAQPSAEGSLLLDVFELAATGREHLWDRARMLDARVKAALSRTALYADAARVAFDRSPTDWVAYDCAIHPGEPRPRGSLACYNSLRAKGDLTGGVAELERLRSVRGGVDLFLPLTLRDALAQNDIATATRALHDMLPAEVTLSNIYGQASLDPSRAYPGAETQTKILAAIATAHDAPIAVAPLERALRADPTVELAGVAEDVVRDDRAHPVLPGTATAVLRHIERYDVAPSGVVHAVIFDVRRVSGTTDVEENAQASAPSLTGRTSLRILRRRVLKHDGTVVEPDPNPGASQGHADLAQLEAGDVVEAIYEGWSVPLETGEIGIDTPDLLPGRTAVHDASIEIHLPKGLKPALWSHPILGAPKSATSATETVLTWTLTDHLARRVEDATPKMDRAVSVSLSTARWSEIGRGLREAILARIDHDPAVRVWADGVAKEAHAETDRAKVDAIVTAVGTVIKEGDPSDLSDLLYGHSLGPQSTTARGILSDHEGSRTWLVVRALREIGVSCELAVAENEPFSASPDFPPHNGRFMHPLAIAHVRDAAGKVTLVPIDADVSGPPLPAGHISPELRGRQALREDGSISPLPEVDNEGEEDVIDERLSVDAHGDARGTFTILLRGREAQDIAEMLVRTVGDPRQRALRGVVLAWVPFANVDSVELSSTEGSWQIALRAVVAIPGYALAAGPAGPKGTDWMLPGLDAIHFSYPRGSSSTLSASYASEGARESALAVSHAVQYHTHRRIELPAGATLVRAPGPFQVKTRALSATRALSVVAGSPVVIEDDYKVGVPTGTVPAALYAAFAKDAHRTDDAFLASTIVHVPPAPK